MNNPVNCKDIIYSVVFKRHFADTMKYLSTAYQSYIRVDNVDNYHYQCG